MSEVTRFDKDMDGSMEPTSDGRWVRSDDYDALRAERNALVHEMEGLRRKLDEALTERDAMGAERDALRADAEAGRKLWAYMVENGLPWSDPDWQEAFEHMGLLVAKDMRAEDSGPECLNCCGDCGTCYRASETLLVSPPDAALAARGKE